MLTAGRGLAWLGPWAGTGAVGVKIVVEPETQLLRLLEESGPHLVLKAPDWKPARGSVQGGRAAVSAGRRPAQ